MVLVLSVSFIVSDVFERMKDGRLAVGLPSLRKEEGSRMAQKSYISYSILTKSEAPELKELGCD